MNQSISLASLTLAWLRSWRRVVLFAVAGGSIAVAIAATKPAKYAASASFVPQASDPGRSGVANLAGQFGLVLPGSGQATPLDFYSRLLVSPVTLRPIVRDSFDIDGRKVSFFELVGIGVASPERREEQAVQVLTRAINVSPSKLTGIVTYSVSTEWPSVSLGIAVRMLGAVNEYNQVTRQGQASLERQFVEGRLDVAKRELRDVEDRVARFSATNRQWAGSPELVVAHDRLQRELTLAQQTYGSLVQAHQEAKIREVRDTPVVTIFEPPTVPTTPEPRGRVALVIVGTLIGALVGALLALIPLARTHITASNDADVRDLVLLLSSTASAARRRLRRQGRQDADARE